MTEGPRFKLLVQPAPLEEMDDETRRAVEARLKEVEAALSRSVEDVFLGRRIVAPDAIDVEAKVIDDDAEER